MKVNMDKIRQYEGSRKKYNPNVIMWTILYPSPDDGY